MRCIKCELPIMDPEPMQAPENTDSIETAQQKWQGNSEKRVMIQQKQVLLQSYNENVLNLCNVHIAYFYEMMYNINIFCGSCIIGGS